MVYKPGQSGNPAGRPKGAKSGYSKFRSYFEEAGEYLVPDLIRMAKQGNMDAMRMCIERIYPRVKENTMSFELPDLTGQTPEGLVKVMFEAMSYQKMTADEINCVLNMIKTFRSHDDAEGVKQVIERSNQILEELRKKNEKEF